MGNPSSPAGIFVHIFTHPKTVESLHTLKGKIYSLLGTSTQNAFNSSPRPQPSPHRVTPGRTTSSGPNKTRNTSCAPKKIPKELWKARLSGSRPHAGETQCGALRSHDRGHCCHKGQRPQKDFFRILRDSESSPFERTRKKGSGHAGRSVFANCKN